MPGRYPKLPLLLRWYIYWELPAWGKLYKLLGLGGIDNKNEKWRRGPTVVTRGKRHGYRMRLDLSDDMDRMTYFLGRYYDLANQLLLDVALKPGDTFIDGGANVGHMTLYAARRVEQSGHVLAFEPNPACYDRICDTIVMNEIKNVDVYDFALGHETANLELHVLGGGTILGTLAADSNVPEQQVRRVMVKVIPGDDLIDDHESGDLFIKLDLEGWELNALRGLTRTIEKNRPAILIEVEPRHLSRSGVTVTQLFNYVSELGYTGYAVDLVRRRNRQYRLILRPVSSAIAFERIPDVCDVFWLPNGQRRFDPSPYIPT